MKTPSSKRTIIRQTLAGFTSLFVGAGVIYVFGQLGNSLNLHFSDGSKYELAPYGWIFGGICLLFFLFFEIPSIPHDEWPDSKNVFKSVASDISAIGGCLYTIFAFIFSIAMLLASAFTDFILALIITILMYVLFAALGFCLGTVQAIAVHFEGLGPDEYRRTMSNQANVQACKAGVLPYQYRVSVFWETVLIVLILVISLIALIFGTSLFLEQGDNDTAVWILHVPLCLFFLFLSLHRFPSYLLALFKPKIASVEGETSKSTKTTRGRYRRTYYWLHCKSFRFGTNKQIWNQIHKGKIYRLWFIPSLKRVIAYEPPGFRKAKPKVWATETDTTDKSPVTRSRYNEWLLGVISIAVVTILAVVRRKRR